MFNLFYYSTMKNIKLFSLLFVAAAMIFAGCTKETESVEPGGGEDEGTEEGLVYKEFKVGASEAGGSKSRTELGDDGKSVLWQMGDMIRVFADVEGANPDGYTFTVTEIQDDGTATISGEVVNAEKFYALYPYDAYNKTGGIIEGSNDSIFISANIPATQTVPVNGGYDPKACISVAQLNTSGKSTFKLACGIIGFEFVNTTNSDIKEIQVIFNDYSIIKSSYMKICVNKEDVVNSFAMIPQQNRVISIVPDEESQVFTDNKKYYVCLPPFDRSQEITVKFINSEGTALVKTVEGQIKRAYSEVSPTLTLKETDYNINISTADEFKTWYNEDINTYGKVTLIADINMQNEELISKDFSGIFEGGNHKISNLIMKPFDENSSNNGLFSKLSGAQIINLTLDNVTIDGGDSAGTICGSDDANNMTYISGCNIINSKITNAYNIGGIIGVCFNTSIDGCAIENIYLSSNDCVGGLVGSFNNSSKFRASYVTGVLAKKRFTGGLVGKWNSTNAMIISCYSFVNLSGSTGYIYGKSETENIIMHSSFYVNSSLQENIDGGIIGVDKLRTSYYKTLNNYLEDANSEFRYVVNPNYSVEDFSTPPLILQKAQ